MSEIDIEYDDESGRQLLGGFIWFEDGSWAERATFNGIEGWVWKDMPQLSWHFTENAENTENKQYSDIVKYFSCEHLPASLKKVSKPIAELAKLMDSTIDNSAEKSAGLRKLLEAKDCFVRASLS
jgi:arginine utilization protein RocB